MHLTYPMLEDRKHESRQERNESGHWWARWAFVEACILYLRVDCSRPSRICICHTPFLYMLTDRRHESLQERNESEHVGCGVGVHLGSESGLLEIKPNMHLP